MTEHSSLYTYTLHDWNDVDKLRNTVTDEIIKIKDAEKEAPVKRAEDRKWWNSVFLHF